MFEAFGQMSQVWEMFQKTPDVENAHKKHRRGEPAPKRPGADHALRIMQAMGNLLLKMDAEQQQLKRQDSWICFMQTDSQAVLPSMMVQAQTWRKQLDNMKAQETFPLNILPLRCHLLQHLVKTLQDRLHRLMTSGEDSTMLKTAMTHNLLTQEAAFPFQRWNPHAKKLQLTNQTPITPSRMGNIWNNCWS